ncbi:MAG TPA: nucleotidyltransferase [Terriglobales bacterium]|nr:nucleotidyltransferase [Terriglobales bacterium]HET7872457.1 nucleotidyltransferase [Terriglobales bacterium]
MPGTEEKTLPVSSSMPPDFAPEQVKLFRGVLQHLNDTGVPYVVSGAAALQLHTGICRDTKDLDLFLCAEHVDAALRSLKEEGFETQVTDPVWLAKAHRGEYYVDLITGMSNAVIVVDQSWIERGVPSESFGVPVKVLAREELIASKIFVTRRERFDGADIAHVVFSAKGSLDWHRLLGLVGQHWEMLFWDLILFHYVYPAHSDFVPRWVWDDLLGRLGKALDQPGERPLFRGSLIDPKMFAIDVNEWGMEDLLEVYRAKRMPKLEPAA